MGPRCLLLLIPAAAFGASQTVDSIAALRAAISTAAPGDTITLKSGTYATDGPIGVRAAGTLSQPITIAADKVGGVEITGADGFVADPPAAYVTISGFRFTHEAGKASIHADTSHVRFTHNIFACPGNGAYLAIAGNDVEIDANDFQGKRTPGAMIAVGGTASQVARRLHIHHNYFHDFASTSSTDAAMIRFGVAAYGPSTGGGVVEDNLFARCRGSAELISNRSSGNTYRFNTFLDSPTSQVTLRHGNACLVYANVFRNTGGLRIFGGRHLVIGNYFERNYIAIAVGNGDITGAPGDNVNGHVRPDHCVIACNILVDNRTHYQMSPRTTDALGASNITFAANILQGGGTAAKIGGPYPGAVWSGNLVWQVNAFGDFPEEGYEERDPLLAPTADGIQRPQLASPTLAHLLKESDVGPGTH